MTEHLQKIIDAALLNGQPAWQETKAKRDSLKDETWEQFYSVARLDLGPMYEVANFDALRAKWEYHHKPPIGTRIIVDLRIPQCNTISVVYEVVKDYPTDLGVWKRGCFPTLDLGFREYRVTECVNIDGKPDERSCVYVSHLDQAIACAKEMHDEHQRVRANALKAFAQLTKPVIAPVPVDIDGAPTFVVHFPHEMPPAPKEATKESA